MKRLIIFAAISVLLIGMLPAGPNGGDEPRAILIKNATIIPVVGDKVEPGQLLIRDGKIYFDRAKYLEDRQKAEEAKKKAAEAPKPKDKKY